MTFFLVKIMILTPEETSALLSPSILELQFIGGEYRIDSRLIAEQLGVEHRATFQQIKKYKNEFEQLSLLTFKMEAVKHDGARGTKREKYALLNEPQSTFCLSLSRNTEKVVKLKLQLTQAFHFYKSKVPHVANPETEEKAQQLSLISKAFSDATRIVKNAGLAGNLGILKANELTTNTIGVDIFEMLQMPRPQLPLETAKSPELAKLFFDALDLLMEDGTIADHGNEVDKAFIHMPSALPEIEKHTGIHFEKNVLYHQLKEHPRYIILKKTKQSCVLGKPIRAWAFVAPLKKKELS
ncbi:MAG: phage regulator Rha-like protein [bacterium]|jgi:phage regulator Rha-like protein